MKALKITLLLAVFVVSFSGSEKQNNTNELNVNSIEVKKSESSIEFLALDKKNGKPGQNQA